MNKIGLDKLDVVTIFSRIFGDEARKDSMVHSLAMAVGEVVEENNKKLSKKFVTTEKEEKNTL